MTYRRFKSHAALLALAALGQPALAAMQDLPPAPTVSDYRLGIGDEVQITVFGQPDMTSRVRVRSDGTIGVALLPSVPAANKTTLELRNELIRLYTDKHYLTNPSINVEIETYVGKTVTVLGAVARPGLYPMDRAYSVAEMIAKAGGAREDGANSVVLTTATGETVRIALYSAAGTAARPLAAGDSLFVPTSEMVFVYGAVNRGGGFPFQPDMTFRHALALAGGPTLAGSTRSIEVRRGGTKIKAQLDDLVQPQDVLVIKEKLF